MNKAIDITLVFIVAGLFAGMLSIFFLPTQITWIIIYAIVINIIIYACLSIQKYINTQKEK